MVAEKTGISVISGSRPNRAGRAGAPPGRVLRSKRKTSRFPKTFPRISLISLPEATTLHPATENPTGSLATPRTAGTLPEQPDHPPPGSAVPVTLGKPEPHRWPADAVSGDHPMTTMAPRCCPRSNAEPAMLYHQAEPTTSTGPAMLLPARTGPPLR